MKVVITEKARELIKNRGGELYLILRKVQCAWRPTKEVVTSFKRPPNGSFKKLRQGDVTLYLSPGLRARGPVTIDVDGFWMLKRIVVIGDLVA